MDKLALGVPPSNHWYQNQAVVASIVTFVALGAIFGAGGIYGYFQGVGTISFISLCSGSGACLLMACISPVLALCLTKEPLSEPALKENEEVQQPLLEAAREELKRGAEESSPPTKINLVNCEEEQSEEFSSEYFSEEEKGKTPPPPTTYADFPPQLMQPANRGKSSSSSFQKGGSRTPFEPENEVYDVSPVSTANRQRMERPPLPPGFLPRNAEGDTLLHVAAKRPTKSMSVHKLVRERLVPLDASNPFGQTALHFAAANPATVKLDNLLAAIPKPNVDALDSKGESPLFYAVRANLDDNVDALLEAQARVEIQNKKGENILHIIAEKNLLDRASLLKENVPYDKWLGLLRAADQNGLTPLHVAAQNGRLAFVKWVLEGIEVEERAAFVNCKTPQEDTLLHSACKAGHLAMYLMLTTGFEAFETANREGKEPTDCLSASIVANLEAELDNANILSRQIMGLPRESPE